MITPREALGQLRVMRPGRALARLRQDHGQVMVLAIVVAVVALLLGLAALTYALNSNAQSTHDQRTRGAQQAADAGVQRQLYLNSDSDTVGYNLSGGVLGLGSFLDCTVPEFNLGVQIGTVQVAAGSAGVCPTSCTSPTSCSSGPPGSGGWFPLGNGNYYESEFFANGDDVGTAGTTNGDAIQFPEIVSIGCHTTASTNPQSSCATGGAGNSYSRQLDILDPTGPLQAAEANNDLTINASTSTLTSGLTTSLTSLFNSSCTTVPLTGIVLTCNGLTGVLSGVLNLLSGLLGLDTISQLVSTTLGDGVGVVDGDITAGYKLYLPGLTVDANTTTGSPDLQLGTLAGVVESAVGALTSLSSLSPTFEYGNSVCSEGSSSTCKNSSSGLSDATPVAAIAPTYVKSTGACQAGTPSSSCTVARPSFTVTSGLTSATTSGTNTIPTGTTLTGTGASASDIDGDLTLSKGTLTFSAGTYVFCSVYAASGTTLTTSGGVQIYIATPGSADCPTSGSGYLAPGSSGYLQLGNFVACSGISNTLSGTGGLNLDTASGVVNPSSFQIYDAGEDEYSGGTTALAAGSTDTAVSSSSCPNITETYGTGSGKYAISTNDPATQVYIGTSTNSLTESMIVYAPESEVTINTTGAFEGSAVGFNVDLTSLAILQDLDLGNYPISTVANAYQVAQVIQCDNSIDALSNTESGNPDQFASSGGPASSGSAGDLNGCAS